MIDKRKGSYQGSSHKRKQRSQKQTKSKPNSSNSGATNEDNSSNISPRKVGADGHYYECVVCDVGGDLLCCETCPRTYHLHCHSPPLDLVPPGTWQCQICSQVANVSTRSTSFWIEQELDSLWVGVRKFGQGNWQQMLKDSSLYFSKVKTEEDLAKRWKVERLKIVNSSEDNSMPSSEDQPPVTQHLF
ncbi:protein CHROMATIN REMODELING 4-like [Euphorbia lathyris]|uniref:protein CHROMATIN REMODELING 4-like n=1 Tax=Euphorbia lathyris TaxID=212925 RepID=UPI0033139864